MRLLIIGAGGHAKVVLDAAIACGFEIAGVIGQPGGISTLMGYPVTHDATAVEADGFIAAIGDNAARAAEFDRLCSSYLAPTSVIHPSAILADSVELGAGTFVAAGVVVKLPYQRPRAHRTGFEPERWCGDRPGYPHCVGTSIVPLARVGEWSIVGAGAVVTYDLPDRSVCVGAPAKAVRSLRTT